MSRYFWSRSFSGFFLSQRSLTWNNAVSKFVENCFQPVANIITNVLSFIRYQQFKAQKERVVDEREDEYEGNIQISYNKTSLKKKLVLRKTNLLF